MPALKSWLQTLLKRLGLYHRLKASALYHLYWRIADRRIIDDRSRVVEFYRKVLDGFRKGDMIFDVGANLGHKTDIFLRLGAKVVAIEPDELNQQVLTQAFLRYRRSEEHTSELQSRPHLVCRLLLEKKKKNKIILSVN